MIWAPNPKVGSLMIAGVRVAPQVSAFPPNQGIGAEGLILDAGELGRTNWPAEIIELNAAQNARPRVLSEPVGVDLDARR